MVERSLAPRGLWWVGGLVPAALAVGLVLLPAARPAGPPAAPPAPEPEPQSYQNRARPLAGGGALAALALSPDGKTLAVAEGGPGPAEGPGRLLLFHFPSGKEIIDRPEPKGARAVAFSPDGATLAVAGHGGALRLPHPRTGHARAPPAGPGREARAGRGPRRGRAGCCCSISPAEKRSAAGPSRGAPAPSPSPPTGRPWRSPGTAAPSACATRARGRSESPWRGTPAP